MHYGIPFGMSDVDRYMEWFNGKELDRISMLTHFIFIKTIEHIYNPYIALVFVPSLSCYIIMPGLLLYFYTGIMNLEKSSDCVFLFVFGTFTPTMFFFTALWSQMMSFMSFILAIAFYTRKNHLYIIASIVSIMIHPYMSMIYFVILLTYLLKQGKIIYFTLILSLSLLTIFLTDTSNLIIPFSNYGLNEPNIYTFFFVYTSPVVVLLSLLGFKNDKYSFLTKILLFTMPFVHIGRGMVFLHVFLVMYAAEYISKLSVYRSFFVYALIILWLQFFVWFISTNMLYEMGLRGLNGDFLADLFKLQNTSGIYIPIEK